MTARFTRTVRLALAALLMLAVCSTPIVGADPLVQDGGHDHGLAFAGRPLGRVAQIASAKTGLELAAATAVALVLWLACGALTIVVRRPPGSAAQARFATPLRI